LALFNSVREVKDGETSIIEYKTPIRVAFSVFYGTNETDALEDILKNSGIEYTKVPRDDLKNMEYSKLFTNLIGIPSYSLGFNIEDGLRNKDAFKEEMLALKEYVAVVKKSRRTFPKPATLPYSNICKSCRAYSSKCSFIFPTNCYKTCAKFKTHKGKREYRRNRLLYWGNN